ncbi:MAG: DUF4878 domain-containing protein [Acidobacteriaceae bacterium]|nr:DUF4878 domain-containing protein [Acidobacteriaceae bacterium]
MRKKLYLLTAFLCLSPLGCKKNVQPPSDTIRSLFKAANESRYDDFEKLLTPAFAKKLEDADPLAMQHLADAASEKGTFDSLDIVSEEVHGQGATVTYIAKYKSAQPHNRSVQLLQQDNVWKVASVPTTTDTATSSAAAQIGSQSQAATPPQDLRAVISCGMNGFQNLNAMACFAGETSTEVELQNGSQYGLYKSYQLGTIGQQTFRGLEIHLNNTFDLKAQNASPSLILGIRIFDAKTGRVMFQKQVSRFGVIEISNRDIANMIPIKAPEPQPASSNVAPPDRASSSVSAGPTNSVYGYLDEIKITPIGPITRVSASGWAGDTTKSTLPEAIFISLDGSTACNTSPNVSRQDVADKFGSSMLSSGWACTFVIPNGKAGIHRIEATASWSSASEHDTRPLQGVKMVRTN